MKRFAFLLAILIAVLGTAYSQDSEQRVIPEEKSTAISNLDEQFHKGFGEIFKNIKDQKTIVPKEVFQKIALEVLCETVYQDVVSQLDRQETNWMDKKIEKYKVSYEKVEKSVIPKKTGKTYHKEYKNFSKVLPKLLQEMTLDEICSEENIAKYFRKTIVLVTKDGMDKYNTVFTVK